MGGFYWLASYPKSGNTWLRTFLQNLLADLDRPVDINQLGLGHIASSRGWMDEVLGFDTANLDHEEIEHLRPAVYQWAMHDDELAFHKIHDACTYTQDGKPLFGGEAVRGVVYIVRNPLDIVPSAANHWNCSIDQAIAWMGQPDFEMGTGSSNKSLTSQIRHRLLSWSQHVLSWVNAPELTVEVVRYEDMLAAPETSFGRVVNFLGLEDDRPRLEKALSFSSFQELSRQEQVHGFRERPQYADRFFRQGKSGEWQQVLSPQQVQRIIDDHGAVMRRFGYLDAGDKPVVPLNEH
ncbi:sulfotransferase domain-containing protein [Methylomonas methanica]|uniref:Sulfotransferase n=1 Tax=Methylomonas methanica (strain DSM 25384 / MC09) TaxID=857087 RepID=F9ZW48_METMM|nr:sulfotransferase domain-containing protein [Methylomonas methanica]AEG02019.1 sulfotransferase [Methylomonas methanica MC09]